MRESSGQQDYRQYEFDKREWIAALALGGGGVLFLAWFFYRSIWAVLPLAPLGYFLIGEIKRKKGEKRRLELTEQFKECILSVSASLQAGYAVENAFLESREDMKNLYGDSSMIYLELEILRRGLVMGKPLEEMLMEFGERSACPEIEQFVQLFAVAKRRGGNLPQMIRTSAGLISQRLEARQEIDVLLSGRKMEQNIMRLMPFGIVFYVGSTYTDYFSPLYHSLSGISVMSVCLVLYIASVWVGERVFQGIWGRMNGEGKEERLLPMELGGFMIRLAGIGESLYSRLESFVSDQSRREELRVYLEILCPEEPREKVLKKYYGGKMALSALIFLAGSLIAVILKLKEIAVGGEESTSFTLWILFTGAAVAIFFLMDKDLRDQIQKRREKLRMGYSDLVHKLALYLVAGMSVRSAFFQIGGENELVGYACREMKAGQAEQLAYEHFGKRAGTREYVKLSTLLCQNLKKGNSTLLARLEEEAVISAEGRLQSSKKLGEEAGTKLLIPMVMQLAMTMLMIMVPAFSMMGV